MSKTSELPGPTYGDIIGVGNNFHMHIRTSLNGDWTLIPNSGGVMAITTYPERAAILGVSIEWGAALGHPALWKGDSEGGIWETVTGGESGWISFAVKPDGVVLGVKTDHQMYWLNGTLGRGTWTLFPNSGLVIAIATMPDGTILGVGEGYQLWTWTDNAWKVVPYSGSVLALTSTVDGTLLAAGYDHLLHTKSSLEAAWKLVEGSGLVIDVTIIDTF